MAFNPSSITKTHVLNAIKKIEAEQIELIKSTRWLVKINSSEYPPKEVMRYAHKEMNGEQIWNYSGGEETNKYLKKMGFVILDMYKNKFQNLISNYKKEIEKTHLKDERYKWELLKTYKGLPNLKAKNFYEEVKNIDYSNLPYAMSKAVLKKLLTEEPEKMRSLFTNLFNEDVDLNTRVKLFNEETLKIYRELGETLQHHQDERTISTYLTYYNPEKYTFYKYSYYKNLCDLLNIEQAKVNERYSHYLELIHRIILDYIENDNELIELVKSFIPEYYNGSNHLLVVQDILYQMFNKIEPINYWVYAPGGNANKWDEFYEKGIMGLGWDALGDLNNYLTKQSIQKKLQELDNSTSTKNNNTAANYEFLKVMKPGDIIIVKKGINELLGYGEVTSDVFYDEERESYKNCRTVDWLLKGNWKLDFNLALKTLTNITKYKEKGNENVNYYDKLLVIMNGNKAEENILERNNTSLNQILYGPPGTGKTYYTTNKAIEIINPNFDFNQDRDVIKNEYNRLVEEGQIVFTTFHQSMSYEDFIEGIKPETVNDKVTYTVKNGIFKQICEKARVKNSSNFENAYDSLVKEIIEQEDDYLVLTTKTGKHFRINVNSNENLNLYTSEEINKQGVLTKDKLFKYFNNLPSFNGWEGYASGVIDYLINKYNLKHNTEDNQSKNYVLIIDEINRGNISQIFGELITLIENDKRLGNKEAIGVVLPYSKEYFSVPNNLHIIGTMNTADRSVEALDTALRRRFSFVEMMPDYDVIKNLEIEGFQLSELLKVINERIELLVDRDHTIGHSYFINVNSKVALANAFNDKIVPLLQEYFYGDYGKIGLVLGKGFVKTIKNPTTKFAQFEYDNAADFITEGHTLITQNEDTIIDSIKQLLNKIE